MCNHKLLQSVFILTLLGLLWGGCNVGPIFTPPEPSVPDQWEQARVYGLTTSQADISTWWRNFGDTRLNALIKRGLSGNLDLEQARSRVRQARAARGIEMAKRFPALSASGGATRFKDSDQPETGLYASEFDAAWELDIFGRVSRRIEASTADMQASVEALRNVQVSMVSEIALNYVEVRSLQNRIRVAEGNVKTRREILRIVRDRYELQLANGLELAQAESSLAEGRSLLPGLESSLGRAMNRLAVLLGEKPGTLTAFLQDASPVPAPPPEIAVGVPADIIRKRPDIRRAEHELAAQCARVGIAMADLYPRFTLTGSLQFSATRTTRIFNSISRVMNIGPAFQWNIFNAGSVRNNIKVHTERQQQALLEYEKTVLLALEEVENAMIAFARELDRQDTLKQAVAAARDSAGLAESLYRDGLKDFIYVLDAQRVRFSAEDQLASSTADVSTHLIRLYKALGGGWHPIENSSENTTAN